MPTYEYACRNCGEHLEVVQSFSDDPLTDCPSCKGQLRKVFSPIGIAFKGSGFYRTDSKGSPSTPAAAKSDAGGKADSGSKADSGASSPAPSSGDKSAAAS
jgi:putative FmdB family regulatory protein